ncbi:hypothetical protein V12G01_04776 [Vibrio alginolyticus 12G01]|nr:hypothetical protein V12G01_04776 [Vibrio alginolyticus 12G01]
MDTRPRALGGDDMLKPKFWFLEKLPEGSPNTESAR